MTKTYQILYSPGPAWITGRPVWEQPLEAHGAYVHGLHRQGRLVLGGPFSGEAGGLALVRAGSDEEAQQIADADPAVTSGVFAARVDRLHPVDWDAYGGGPCAPFVAELIGSRGATPRVVRALLAGLSAEQLVQDEGPGTWSTLDVLRHLVDGERALWIPRVRTLLESGEDQPFEPYRREIPDSDDALETLLQRFAAARAESLVTLRELGLSEEDLARTGRHPEFGRVTLRELLAAWATHDLGHVRQIARVLAKRPGAAAGPWSAYLPVVRELGGASGPGLADDPAMEDRDG